MPDYLHEIEAQLAALHTAAQQGEAITPEQIQVVREILKQAKPQQIEMRTYLNELRPLISIIVGYIEILERLRLVSSSEDQQWQKNLDIDTQQMIQILHQSAQQMGETVNNLQEVYKQE